MKHSLWPLFLSFAALMASVFIFSDWSGVTTLNDEPCQLDQGSCPIQLGPRQGRIMLTPQPIPLEEELTLQFELPEGWQLNSAVIEGVNMYMGQIPVIFEGPNRGITFLGACSEPRMQWRLALRLEQQDQNATISRELYFTTQR
ncbi:hypothetical protein HMF8227_01474 [Saliniradius amylolyticus]|uniref:Uncharacterized protein n=1 Tax=Saliniradius amylolyticus TaxID=2183582 RepID=A0A2S2E2X4_9ALTE|nr:hypothetical protein [Saliniradius amylolyticus]AWL11949.1 hypothetical protein HMF8227_01474 [Saliniradius amylolyticus]